MTSVRTQKNKNYTTINNTVLNDAALSWKAKGLAAYLLSKPDDWRVRRDHLARQSADGVSSVRSALQELEKFGYLLRQKTRNNDGKIVWEYVLYEEPQNRDPLLEKVEKRHKKVASPVAENQPLVPLADNPPVVFPPVENPPVENRTLLNTDIVSTELLSTELSSTEKTKQASILDLDHAQGAESSKATATATAACLLGFHSLAQTLIEEHLPTWHKPIEYLDSLSPESVEVLVSWLWVVRLLRFAPAPADYETDRGFDVAAYQAALADKADIDERYAPLFAGVGNWVGLIRSFVVGMYTAPLLSIDRKNLLYEAEGYHAKSGADRQ